MDVETESSELYIKLLEWGYAHRKQLIIGLVALVAIGAAIGIFAWKSSADEADADNKLFAVPIAPTPGGLAPASPSTLLDVARDYPGTSAGRQAALLAAEALFTEGKYPEALEQFSKFIADHPESPLVPQAKVGVAASLEGEGKTSEAIQRYHEIILTYPGEPSIVSPAKLTLARLYEDSNNPQEAYNLYGELARMLSQNPYDPWAAEARERLQNLVAKHPELMKSQTPPASVNPMSIPQIGNPSAPAPMAAPKAPATGGAPKLLSLPNLSSNAPAKP